MVICKNCGAEIDENDVECPYCHSMQYDAAEKKYIKNLYELNDNMDLLDDEAKKFIRNQTVKKVFITLGAIAAAFFIGIFSGYRKYLEYNDSASQKQEIKTSFDWYNQNIDQLQKYILDGEYKKASELFDTYKGSYEVVRSWDNYGVLHIYSRYYEDIEDAKEIVESDEEIYFYEYKYAYKAAIELINIMNTKDGYDYKYIKNCDDISQNIITGWFYGAENYLTDVAEISKEEYEQEIQDIFSSGQLDYDIMQTYAKQHFTDYSGKKSKETW